MFTIPNDWLTRQINVLLIGCGGTGSEILDELYRINFCIRALGGSGLKVTAYDGDEVSPFNLGRQRFFPADIGMNKAKVLIGRYAPFGAENWSAEPMHFKPSSALNRFDLVVTAVDSAAFRYELGRFAQKHSTGNPDTLWLDMGNGNSDGQVVLGHLWSTVADRLPNFFDLYATQLERIANKKEPDTPSCSHEAALASQDFGVNRQAARHGASLLWRLLRYGKLEHHCIFFDVATGEGQPIKIDPLNWQAFGYSA